MALVQATLFEDVFTSQKTTIVLETQAVPNEPVTETALESIIDTIASTDPNYKLFEMMHEGTLTREYALQNYKPLGLTEKLEGSRGLPDMHKKRELNMGQFFTPSSVVKALTDAAGLDRAKNLTIVDNSMGIGSMFQHIPESNSLYGIELDEKAFTIAQYIWPNATIINDNLINHPLLEYEDGKCTDSFGHAITPKADAYVINPPFSLQINKKNLPLANAKWGKLGPDSSIESHIAALEIALNNSRLLTAAIVPTTFFENASTYAFEKRVSKSHIKLLRLDLPSEAFKEYGTEWNCSIVIYVHRNYRYNEAEPIHMVASSMADVEPMIETWKQSSGYGTLLGEIEHYNTDQSPRLYLEAVEEEDSTPKIITPDLPLEYTKKVSVSVNANSSGLVFKPKDLLTALKCQELIDEHGTSYGYGSQSPTSRWWWNCRRMNIIKNGLDDIISMQKSLEYKGLNVVFDQQTYNWLDKCQKKYELESTPYEKVYFDEELGIWITKHSEDGIRTKYADRYNELKKKLKSLNLKDKDGNDWLWDYQEDDVIRICMKSSVMYSGDMGVGKTRTIIAAIMLAGNKHSLIVVESKLVKEFLNEFKKLGIDADKVNVVTDEKTVNNLKQFNIISYSKLWRPIRKDTKKAFIKILKKKVNFVAFDEAHNLKAKDTKQARAARQMFGRCKRIVQATGTLINNYPRNIFSLLVAGWGDGTELNEYGYYCPSEESSYRFTTGTRAFAERFIMVSWYTEQFAQTLDKGMKSMEVPMVEDIDGWYEMLDPKMIRRTNNEPDVEPHMKFPAPVFHDIMLKTDTDHLLYYKKWLEEFANWFEQQLALMKVDTSHNINTAIILAHLTKLQFAATIPQSEKTDIAGFEWEYDLTMKQKKTIELTKTAIANDEKVIIFSERPAFLKYMNELLANEGINSVLFTGEIGIEKRIKDKEEFQTSPDVNVLLATTTCGETGLNIPEASTVIMVDRNWTPSKTKQAYSRILRPQQQKEPHIYFLGLEGTIDEYMKQLCELKADGIDQAIDEKQVGEFNPESYMSYKDFSYKMLKQEGLVA